MSDNKDNAGVYKSVAGIFLISGFCRLFGFAREVVIANEFGTSPEADAYSMAIRVLAVFTLLFGPVLCTSFMPYYTHTLAKSGEKIANKLTSNFLNIIMLAGLAVTIVCEIYAPQIVGLMAHGYDDYTMKLTINMTRMLLPAIIFSGMYFIFSAVLNARKKFFIVELATANIGLMVVLSVLLFTNKLGPYSMAMGTLLAYLFQFAFLVPILKKNYSYTPYLNVEDDQIKDLFKLMLPSIIGVAATEIGQIVDSMLASTLPSGNVASINYAMRIITLATSLVIAPLVTVSFTQFSESSAKDDNNGMKYMLKRSMEGIISMSLPVVLFLVILSEDIVRIIYQRGEFTEESVTYTNLALRYYAIGLLFLGIKNIFNRAFYAKKNMKTPMITGIMYIGIKIILNFILIKPFGIKGLAVADSIAIAITMVIMYFAYTKKYGPIDIKTSLLQFGKIIFAGIACGVGCLVVNYLTQDLSVYIKKIDIGIYVRFLLECGIGVVCYAAALWILKVEEFSRLAKLILNKITGGKKK